MKTKIPRKVVKLIRDIDNEARRLAASGRRHINATTAKTKPGGSRERVSVSATRKAFEALLWLDAGFVGTPDYMGLAWFWNYEYRHQMRDASFAKRQRVHAAFLKAGLTVDDHSDEHAAIVNKEARS